MSFTYSVCPACQGLNRVQSQKALEKHPVCGKCGKGLPMHGLVSEARGEDFRRILQKSELPVVVDFWASWCGPCRSYAPEFEKASTQVPGAVFLKISTETEPELSAQLGIRGIPCTILFKNGVEAKRQAGAMSAQQVGAFVSP